MEKKQSNPNKEATMPETPAEKTKMPPTADQRQSKKSMKQEKKK